MHALRVVADKIEAVAARARSGRDNSVQKRQEDDFARGAGPRGHAGVPPPSPWVPALAAPGGMRHADILARHVASSFRVHAAFWARLHVEVVDAFCQGASYVVVPTAALFADALVAPALGEIEGRWNHTLGMVEGRAQIPADHAPLWSSARPWLAWVTDVCRDVVDREAALCGTFLARSPHVGWSTRVGCRPGADPGWHSDGTFLTAAVTCAGRPTEYLFDARPGATASRGGLLRRPGSEQPGDTVIFSGLARQRMRGIPPVVHRRPPQHLIDRRWTHFVFYGDAPRQEGYYLFGK